MASVRKQSIITGLLILSMAAIAPFCMMYIPSKLIVLGDMALTVNNIREASSLFSFGIVCETLIFLLEIVISVMIYRLFEKASKTLALISSFSRFAMAIIQGVNVIIQLSILSLVTNPLYNGGLGINGTNALVNLFINSHNYGVSVWQIFFGFHLITLGFLLFKSKYMPSFVGIMVMIASLGYLADSYKNIFFITNDIVGVAIAILLILSTVGELLFTFWLIIKGIKTSGDKISINKN